MSARRLQSRSSRGERAQVAGRRPDSPLRVLLAAGFIHPGRGAGLAARVDRYQVFKSLGTGSMGMVVWGWDLFHARPVAIKFLRPDLGDWPGLSERFLREAGHLERLRHRRIIPVIDVSRRAGCPYFVMPFLAGGSLAGEILARGAMDAARVWRGARQIAEALAHAHRVGVLHRDVKPSNVLIDDEGGFCLADFGLARFDAGGMGSESKLQPREGTAAYMSPAVAGGEAEGVAGDIYAFGALVYEMLTGRPPYRGRTTREVLRRVLAGPPVPVRIVRPEASPALADIAEAAMAREPKDRYPGMSRVLADLDRAGRGLAPRGAQADE